MEKIAEGITSEQSKRDPDLADYLDKKSGLEIPYSTIRTAKVIDIDLKKRQECQQQDHQI